MRRRQARISKRTISRGVCDRRLLGYGTEEEAVGSVVEGSEPALDFSDGMAMLHRGSYKQTYEFRQHGGESEVADTHLCKWRHWRESHQLRS